MRVHALRALLAQVTVNRLISRIRGRLANCFDRLAVPVVYDAINAALFLPLGGSGRLRQLLVDALDVQPGDRVLELGCGTGQVTARLVAARAEVVAVDELPAMLDMARRRAPAAAFVTGDAIGADVGTGYDRVVLSFVLHGFDGPGRIRLLERGAGALAPGGRIGVLDWGLPAGRVRRAMWRRLLRGLEPAPLPTLQVLDGALETDIPGAGLVIESRRHVARGRAQILVISRPVPSA